jgi:predicted nuclease with TOPRIM domain
VFSGLNARQQFMETHVQTVIPQISEFPVLAPEMEAVEMARKALEEVKAAQQTLQARTAQQTLEVQHRRQVLGHVRAELRSLEEISRKMPHKAEYYEKNIVTLGSMIVSHIGPG